MGELKVYIDVETEAIVGRLRKLMQEVETVRTELTEEIERTGETARQGIKAVDKKVVDHALSGISLQIVGLVWLFGGIVVSTWWPELGTLFYMPGR